MVLTPNPKYLFYFLASQTLAERVPRTETHVPCQWDSPLLPSRSLKDHAPAFPPPGTQRTAIWAKALPLALAIALQLLPKNPELK